MGSAVKVLLDSVILIDHLNNVPMAAEYLRTVAGMAVISVVTRAEVLAGFEEGSEATGLRLLDLFPVLPLTADVADEAARMRRRHRLRLPDAFQAALAVRHGLELATRNERDFFPERFPFVTIPYRV